MSDAIVVDARRTPIGVAGRSLAGLRADELAAPVLAALADRLPDRRVDRVVLATCDGSGNPARVAALGAGLAVGTAASTLDLQCAGGLAAVTDAAALVTAGAATWVLAGGVQSASSRPGARTAKARFAPDGFDDPELGVAADRQAAAAGLTRTELDAYAVRSHTRAAAASTAGRFAAELVDPGRPARDEQIRPRLSEQLLWRLPPVFAADGLHTVATASGVHDGAAAVTLVDEATHATLGGPGLRIVATAVAGVDPGGPGRGLVPAVERVLDVAGVGLDRVAVVELTEAFAGQVLACCRELDLEPQRVCADGGALALGHPWGASGAVLMVRLYAQLRDRSPGTLGLAAVSAGGGQGVAVLVERTP